MPIQSRFCKVDLLSQMVKRGWDIIDKSQDFFLMNYCLPLSEVKELIHFDLQILNLKRK